MKRMCVLLSISLLLISCTSSTTYIKLVKSNSYEKNIKGFNALLSQFCHDIENIWGRNEVLVAGPKDYVQYTDHFTTRSHINFDCGTITIETIASDDPLSHLRKEIISTLLIDHYPNPNAIEFYSYPDPDYDNKIINKPFLYDQIWDNKGQPIRSKKTAQNFADYLLKVHLRKRISSTSIHPIFSITTQLISNHVDKRACKYLSMVNEASRQYGIERSLILSIIETESSFNPYAVSNSDALGLMQVVQHSAGRDVFKMKGKWGQPSRRYLFDPQKNIDTGTAYLAMLQNCYLAGIVNPISRRYAVISAYNGGVSSVLRVFSKNPTRAFQIINNLRPDDVYKMLYTRHPSTESRLYLDKVNKLQKNYCHRYD